jgi:hypothetical protein
MAITIKLRRDTALNWTTYNPTLAAGEMGLEIDTAKFKFGDGITQWKELLYASTGGDVAGPIGRMEDDISEISSNISDISTYIDEISGKANQSIEDINGISAEIYTEVSGILDKIDNNYTNLNRIDNVLAGNIQDVSSLAIVLKNWILGYNDTELEISAKGLSSEVLDLTISNYDNNINIEILSSNVNELSSYSRNSITDINNNIVQISHTITSNNETTTQNISDISGIIDTISTDLIGKANVEHTQEISSVINLEETLNNKVNVDVYNANINTLSGNVNDLSENVNNILNDILPNKSDINHTHVVDNIDGLTDIVNTTVRFTGDNYNNLTNFIGLNDTRTVDNEVSSNEFVKKVIDINNIPENYSDEDKGVISSNLTIYNDGLSFTKNNVTTNYSLNPASDKQLVVKSDIAKLNIAAIGENVVITRPNFDNSNSNWSISTKFTNDNAEDVEYRVYFRQDIVNPLSDTSAYKEDTRLVSDTEVYGLTNRLSTDIADLATRVVIALSNLERYNELSGNVKIDLVDSEIESTEKSFRYATFPLAAVIDDTAKFTSEYYKLETVTIKTADNLAEANYIFNYYDYYARAVCAAIYVIDTRVNENNIEYKTLVRLARSTNFYVLEPSTEYTFNFSSAISNIANTTLYVGFEMVHSNEKINFPVDKIVQLPDTLQASEDESSTPSDTENEETTAVNHIGLCLLESDITNPILTLSVPSLSINGSIVKDVVDIVYEKMQEISDKIYDDIEIAVDNLSGEISSLSAEVYNSIDETAENLSNEISSLSSEVYTYLDNNITTDKVFFKDDMLITNTFGNYVVDNKTGYYIVSCAGQSVQQFLTGALVQRQNPPKSDNISNKPTVTYSGNVGNFTGEVGTTYTLPTVELTFNDKGEYKYGSFKYDENNVKINQSEPNVSITSAYIKQTTGITNENLTNCENVSTTGKVLSLTIAGDNETLIYTDDISATVKNYNIEYYYKTSNDDTIPYDNIGNAAGDNSSDPETNYEAYQIKEITSTTTKTVKSVKSWRSRFFGYMDKDNKINIADLIVNKNEDDSQADPVRNKLSTSSYTNAFCKYSSKSDLPKTAEMTNVLQMFWVIPVMDNVSEIIVTDPLGGNLVAVPYTVLNDNNEQVHAITYVHGSNNYESIPYKVFYIQLDAARTGTNEKFTIALQ